MIKSCYRIRLGIYLKKGLIVNQYILINTLKLKNKFSIIEYIKIFKAIKYQNIMNIVLV